MKLCSWNVNGLRAIVKKDFFTIIKKIAPDILCIQETKAQDDEVLSALSSMSGYKIYVNSATKKGYSGTVLMSKIEPISYTNGMGIYKHDQEGRIQCAEFSNFYLINVYVPNAGQNLRRLDDRKCWDGYFLNFLKKLEKVKPVIVGGDFNVAHQPIDLKNDKSNYNKTAGYTQIEIDGMNNLMNAGFVDSYRYLYPHKITYTYWSYRFKARERNAGWRIDYFLLSKSLVNKIKSASILLEYYGSDHCPIALEIDF